MIRVEAHAKVNLYLHVVGRRADGHHLLDSLVAFAGLHDTLTVEPADDLSLTLDGPFGPSLAETPDNLVLRAARALAEARRLAPRARLTLTKRIPVAAGLGGGSADAAAALNALSRLWEVAIPDGLALRLGADLPVCLAGRPSFMAGIGERLTPAPALPAVSVLLVNPGVALPTREVFRARRGAFSQAAPFNVSPRNAAGLAQVLRHRRNDLTLSAMGLAPAIRDARALVASTDGCLLARMSGSGATVFGLYASDAAAAAAAAAVGVRQPGWWTWSGALRPG